MTRLSWDAPGKRYFETGIERGVLYVGDKPGVPWTGLTSVNETPSNGETKAYYVDGVKYLNRVTPEEYDATIEAYTYPDEFAICDGTAPVKNGLFARHQKRKPFGLCYKSFIGNDIDGPTHAYKLHIIYDALAEPAPQNHSTMGESTEAFNFSWHITTKAPLLESYRPTSHMVIDSRETPDGLLSYIEDILYGDELNDPRLPVIGELAFIFTSYLSNALDAEGPISPAYYNYDGGSPTSAQNSILDGGMP